MEKELLSETNKTGIIIIIGIFLMLFMTIILLLFFYFSKKKIIQKELEKKNLEIDHKKDLLQASIETQEEERQRIARDLHDDISSKLNIISLNSHLLANQDLTNKEITSITKNIIELINKTLENSRRIAHDLLPPVLDKFGLNAGLEELCFEINSSKIIKISYTNNVDFNNTDKSKHLHIFRIIQELVNNSLRHGKATAISILFKENNELITCMYSDNGVGFNIAELKQKKGLGMKNIESRIIFLNGTINIESVIDQGTYITFNF